MLRALAEKREHERDVLLKAMEENSNFSKMAEEKLQMKMEQIKENREAHLAALIERLQEKVRIADISVVTKKAQKSKCPHRHQDEPISILSNIFHFVVLVFSGETCSFGAQEQRAEGRADGMSLTQVLTSMVHQRPFIPPCPLPRPALTLLRTDTQPLEAKRFEDLTTTSQHTTPPVLTTISIISGYKHQ